MSEWVANFYDLLSADYHAMYTDWRSEVLRQGKILDAFIRRHCGARQVSVLDCTCGIGTQAMCTRQICQQGRCSGRAAKQPPSAWTSHLPSRTSGFWTAS